MLKYLVLFLVFAAQAQAEISAYDDLDNKIVLKQPAQRVIALAPHLVELAWTAGLGEKLVAAVDYSDYPEPAKALPRIGNSSVINIESIIALKPDLVLAWAGANKNAEIEQLKKLGIPVYSDDAHNFNDIAHTITQLAKFANKPDAGKTKAEAFLQKITQLRQENSDKEAVTSFYQVWNKPIQSLNKSTLIHQVIKLCGGINIFANEKAVAPVVSIESVISANPQVMFSGSKNNSLEPLSIWMAYDNINAVKNKQLYTINPDLLHRHSMRIAEGAELMCQAINKARAINKHQL
ncbi:cobalamin-binding protein [Agaribacterium sp. ZY112]|uniref:cobalamin-binding protein n=1 Tax=Agaribacterium sp. ZY112 TaxID=3233574 RepID=UPI003524F4F7